jgi:hypothetical protein
MSHESFLKVEIKIIITGGRYSSLGDYKATKFCSVRWNNMRFASPIAVQALYVCIQKGHILLEHV